MSAGSRPPILGVSLKLYLDPERSVAWASRVAETARASTAAQRGDLRLFVLPSLPALAAVRDVLAGTGVAVGAQDLWWADRGAYTGGVSGADLAALGCSFVEVGHAERRRWFGEDDVTIGRKLAAAVRNGITPVLCLGEPEDVGHAAATFECVDRLDAILDVADAPLVDLVVAYEPEWAIGADRSASPEHVDAVCAGIRTRLDALGLPGSTDVIYGGSAGPGLLSRLGPQVDGLFLGRFAHDPEAFARIVDEAASVR